MIGIVVSEADRASTEIFQQLLSVADWTVTHDEKRPPAKGGGKVHRTENVELRTFEELHLYLEDVADAFENSDLVVFASRHSGETGPLLTAHHPGNFGGAEYGGADRDLARACPNAHDRVLDALTRHAPDKYDVGMECTHHGPTDVGAPSMFVEVGSGPDQWDDTAAARAVAKSILDIREANPDRPREDGQDSARRHLVGIGGNHYVPRFERVARETDWSLGHIAADWALEELDGSPAKADVLREAFRKSAARYALIDGDDPEMAAEIESLGYEIVSETWLRAVEGVALSFVRRIENQMRPVDEGLRFGDLAEGTDDEFEVVDLPAALLDEANGVDQTATRDAIESVTLAFETEQSGTLVGNRAALPAQEESTVIVEALADVLQTEYDDVQVEGDRMVARELAFDPALAEQAGVPEGPKFGRLAAGESVEVDGKCVEPADVRAENTETFPIE